MESFGMAMRRLRGEMGLRELARRAHVNASYLSRIESGKRPVPSPDVVSTLDRALGGTGELVRLARRTRSEPWPASGECWARGDSERLAQALVDETPIADDAVRLAHDWLISDPPQVYELTAGRRIDISTVERVERRVHQLRRLDDHLGGEHTYPIVTGELTATLAMLREAAYTETTGRRLLVALGELCQLAGYVANDAGRYSQAERLFLAGMRAAHAGGDAAGAANCLSTLSYQVANGGDPHRAAMLARSAYAGARHTASATTQALLLERVAWAHALLGEAGPAERALGDVNEAYAKGDPNTDPAWVYWMTADEVDIMAGRVWTELRRPLRAVPILQETIPRYGDERPRETALYTTWLAEALLQAQEVDHAAELATSALVLARRSHSTRATERVGVVREMLAPYRRTGAVEAFEEAWSSAAPQD